MICWFDVVASLITGWILRLCYDGYIKEKVREINDK